MAGEFKLVVRICDMNETHVASPSSLCKPRNQAQALNWQYQTLGQAEVRRSRSDFLWVGDQLVHTSALDWMERKLVS